MLTPVALPKAAWPVWILNQSARDAAGPVGVSRIVYFDYDSYVIKPEFQAVIEACPFHQGWR